MSYNADDSERRLVAAEQRLLRLHHEIDEKLSQARKANEYHGDSPQKADDDRKRVLDQARSEVQELQAEVDFLRGRLTQDRDRALTPPSSTADRHLHVALAQEIADDLANGASISDVVAERSGDLPSLRAIRANAHRWLRKLPEHMREETIDAVDQAIARADPSSPVAAFVSLKPRLDNVTRLLRAAEAQAENPNSEQARNLRWSAVVRRAMDDPETAAAERAKDREMQAKEAAERGPAAGMYLSPEALDELRVRQNPSLARVAPSAPAAPESEPEAS